MITTNNGSFPGPEATTAEGASRVGSAPPGAGRATDEMKALGDRLARQAIEAQRAAGCDLPTDGLGRRDDPVGHWISGLSGVAMGDSRDGYPAGGGRYRVPIVQGEIGWTTPVLVEDFLFASEGNPAGLKMVLTGPYTLAVLSEDQAYGDAMTLAMALATAFNQELRALQLAGALFVQIDEPALLQRPEDFPIFTRVWEVLGRGISNTLALHLEGGPMTHLAAGIVRLKRLGCVSIDCVTAPENLDAFASIPLPEGTRLDLGLVSGRTKSVEDPDALARAVRGAAGLPDWTRLLLGTGTDLGGLDQTVASAKLAALATARRLLLPA
jgi:5-methyltetrahydropteroyltriglutamate--homocysteine methyltransferase